MTQPLDFSDCRHLSTPFRKWKEACLCSVNMPHGDRSPCQFSGSRFFPIKALTLVFTGNPTLSQLLLFLPLSLPAAGDEGHCKKLPEVPSFLALIFCFKLLINRSASHFLLFKFPRPYSYSFPHTLNAYLIEPVNGPLSTQIPTWFSTGKGLSNHQAGNQQPSTSHQ